MGGGGLISGRACFFILFYLFINFFFGGGGGLVSDFTVYFITGTLLRLLVEYAKREVSRLSFTVKTPLLSGATKQVSIGNIMFY